MKRLYLGLLLYSVIQNCHGAFLLDPDLEWHTATTQHFYIHYHSEVQPLIQDVALIAERAHQRVSHFFNWEPKDRTNLILIDRFDTINGFAFPMPRNTMAIFVSPPDDVDVLSNYHDWLDLVITHEYTHIIHMDKVAGLPKGGRGIFGRFILFFPNALQPPWVLEGLATYHESQLEPGVGRGRDSVFRALMRMEVDGGIKPISVVNMPNTSWPSGHTRYLYGVYFFNFLVDRYGIEKVQAWIDNYSDNIIPFLINNTSRKSLGKTMSELWDEFTQYLREDFEPEINQLKQRGLSQSTRLTHSGYFTGFPRTDINGNLYYLKNDFLSRPMLMRRRPDSTQPEPVTELHSGRFDVHPQAGIVAAQLDAYRNTNLYSDLYIIDPDTGESRQITDGQRYKNAAWSPDGSRILALRIINGQSELHLLSASGIYQETLWKGNNKETVSALDWHASSDTKEGDNIIATVWRNNSHWNLERFDLAKKRWEPLLNTPVNEFQAQFSPDGDFIYFSSDADGIYNIYRLNTRTNKTEKITNELGGAISVAATPNGKGIYYMGLNHGGTDVYYMDLPASPKTVETFTQRDSGELLKLDANENAIDASILNTQPYTALDKIMPTSWFPFAAFVDDREEIGFSTAGADPLFRHNYLLLAGYDIEHNWGIGILDYRYDRWNPSIKFYAERKILTYYDDNDELDSFRSSDTITLELLFPYIKRDFQWTFHLGASMEKEADEKLVNRTTPVDDFRDELVGAAISFNSADYFPLGISLEDGYRFRLVYEDSDTLNSDFSGQVGTTDLRGYFSLTHKQVLATRLVMGYGNETPHPFRLGGYDDGIYMSPPGAALAEPTEEVLNKRDYALRGYPQGLVNLRGRRMLLADIEYRFPILLVEKTFMAPPIGLQQLHGLLFYSAGDAWDEGSQHDDFSKSVGLELNAEMLFGYMIPINLRLGFAHGMDDGGEDAFYAEIGGNF